MIKDIIENLDIDFKRAVFDNYQLKDGLYVRVGKEVEYFIYKKPKKAFSKEVGLKDLEGNIRANEYEWFVRRDYFSNYLNSNKSIDPPKKKIHNNNYLTLFVKAKEFNEENRDYFVEKLYENVKIFKSFRKKQEKEVIKSFESYIFNEKRLKDIENKKQKFLEIFNEILEKKSLVKESEYIRLYFDEELEKYINESKIYFVLKIYNKIETIRRIDNEIYGLSDFNMGLNAKKPYLEHKTRGFTLPFMVRKDEIFRIKELFDFLKYQSKLIEISPTKHQSGIFIVKHSNNDQAEIIDFDILVKEDKLDKKFTYKDYLSFKPEDREISSFKELFNLLDDIFYNGNLKNNLFGDVYSKLSNNLRNLIYLTRNGIIALKKGEIIPLLKINKKFADEFIIYHLRQNRYKKAKEALNLKLSLLAYEGEEMNIKETLKEIEGKIENLEELNENEFFILSGQIIKYLLRVFEK